jgi:C4-dicarboxylate transporter DctM subunit
VTLALILVGLVAILLTGIPLFAGLSIASVALLVLAEGRIAGLADEVYAKLSNYLLVAIPLFAFMAHVMIRAKVVDDLYALAHTLVRHWPGGLGVATVLACTVFAAISGSSVATALTIGAAAIPQMLRYGYRPHAAYGVLAAGGTLGILIPPSGPMVLYGVVSDTSIGALFIAGVVPGLVLAALFAAFCVGHSLLIGGAARPERAGLAEIWSNLRRSVWSLVLPPLVLGGMYAGVFTATEAAAVGAIAAVAIAGLAYRALDPSTLFAAARETARTTAMLFLILAAAAMFGHVLTILRLPAELVELVVAWGVSEVGFLVAVMAAIFVLGMFLETISIILVTTPLVLPVMQHLGINPVWYGVLLTINLELALITPPVGMNLFVIKGITAAPMATVVRGVMPYVALLILGLGLVMLFPPLALWLPSTMALGR